MNLLDQALDAPAALPQEIPADVPQARTLRNLRAGALGAVADVNTLVGQTGAALGADQFAQGRFSQANLGRMEAEAIRPEGVQSTRARSLKDAYRGGETLSYLGDIVRNAPDTIVQSLPGMVPAVGAGLAGGAVAGTLGAIAGGAAAGLPQEAGDTITRMRAQNPRMSDQEVLAKGVGTGAVSSVAQNAIPGLMGGKLATRTLASAAPRTLAKDVAVNLTEGVVGEGVGGAAAEGLKQVASGQPVDPFQIAEVGIQNAVAGAPLAGVGLAGDRRAAAAQKRATTPLGTAEPPDAAKALGEASKATQAARDTLKDLDSAAQPDDTASRVAAGTPLGDLKEFATATGERLNQMFDESSKKAGEWAKQAAATLRSRKDLTPEERATVDRAEQGDEAARAEMAGMTAKRSDKDRASKTLDDLEAEFKGVTDVTEKGSKKSADTSGADAAVQQVLEPYLEQHDPEIRKRAAGVTRVFVQKAREGELSEQSIRRMTELLGDKGEQALMEVFDKVAPKDAVGDARFARNLDRIRDVRSRDDVVGKAIEDALPKDHTLDVGKVKESLLAWARGESRGGPDMRGATYHRVVRERIEQMFPGNGEKVLKALEIYTNRESDKPGSEKAVADKTPAAPGDEPSEIEFKPTYYGAGSNPLASKVPMPSPELHRAQYDTESRAEQLIKKLTKDNPDRAVRFVSEAEVNKERGQPGGATDRGFVVIEEAVDPTKFNERDLKATRLDAKKFGRSPSRLEIAQEGDQPVLLDAVKLTSRFLRNQESGTGDADIVRNGKAFMDGVSAVMAQHGKFNVPDSTVIDKLGNTFGAVKQAMKAVFKAEDDLSPNGKARLEELRKEYKAAGPEERALLLEDVKNLYQEEKDAGLAGFDVNTTSKAQALLDAELRYDTDIDENVHRREAAVGPTKADGPLGRKLNMDETPQSIDKTQADVKPAMAAISRMKKVDSAPARKLAARAAHIAKNADSMSAKDVARFNTIAGMKSLSEAAAVVNDLASRYKEVMAKNVVTPPPETLTTGDPTRPKGVAAKTAALDQAASSSDPALLKELSTTTDAAALQRTANHLAAQGPSAALDAANARLAELVQDPDVAYDLTKKSAAPASGPVVGAQARQDVRDHITKVLGGSVRVAFKRIFHEGDFTPDVRGPNGVYDLIRISVHSLDPMSTAYHESLHALVKQLRTAGAHDLVNTLQKTADSVAVRKQLEALVGGNAAVMKQLRGAEPEERIAYMYQLWATGQLVLDTKPKTMMGKIAQFLREALGVWSNDQRALHIMEHFNSGDYARVMHNRDLVMQLFDAPGRNDALTKAREMSEPFMRMADAVFAAGSERVRDTDNPYLTRIADLIKPKLGDTKGGDLGFVAAARLERTRRMNEIGARLGQLNEVDRKAALEQLQTGVAAATPEARIAAREISRFLAEQYRYMRTAGVQINHLDDYFPRVWDANAISKDVPAFRAMMDRYVQSGQFTGSVDDLVRTLTSNDGTEFDVDVRRPGQQHAKERVLDFIDRGDAAPFLSKDLFRTLDSYVTQATRRAEWERRFQGEDAIETLLDKAKASGAKTADIVMTEKFLKANTGTLGDSMNPQLRRLQGNMIVYQNVRLLPLAIFSSVVDPIGLAVRGASVSEAWGAFKRGVREIPNNLRDQPRKDAAADMAELMGTIDDALLTHTLGAVYQQGMVGDTARKINDSFFRYNLMEGWNRSMRIAGTEAAIKFIGKHGDGSASVHSRRWMDELGLTAADIHRKANGDLMLSELDGLTSAQALKMRLAVNKWVDGAVLRPDAADKPIWHSDPRFALVAHLKQFVYAFQHTIVDRVAHEAENGNYAPAMALATYVPVMIAADMIKGFLTTGGGEPEWKKNWGASDYIWNGVQRAGLLGVGQFRHDMIESVQRGGTPIGALEGPTLDQLTAALKVVGGRGEFDSFVLNAMPANALYKDLGDGADSPETASLKRQALAAASG